MKKFQNFPYLDLESIVNEFETEVNGKICEIGTGEILQDVSESGKARNWDEKKKLNLLMSDLY